MQPTDFDLNAILANLYRLGPSQEERKRAGYQAAARTGLGILAANQPSTLPRNPLGTIAQGGMAGLDEYQNSLKQQTIERRANAGTALQGVQLKKQLEQQQRVEAFAAGLPEGDRQRFLVDPAGYLKATQPQPPQPFTLAPGARRYGPDGNLIVESPAKSEPFTLTPGARRYGPGGELIAEGPPQKPEATPNEIQLYEYAKKQGFMGSLNDWITSHKKAGAAQNRQVTNVNAFTPASEEAQKDFMKGLRARYDTLTTAPVTLQNIERAKALIPGAAGFMGTGGETLLEASKFLNNRLGMSINTEGVKNAEELRTRIFFQIMDNLKKLDAQPSQMQQTIMMESLGKLGTDPNALPAILDSYAEVIRGKVERHNVEAEESQRRGVVFPYDPVIKLPSPAAPSAPQSAPAAQQAPQKATQAAPKIRRYNPKTGKIE